MSNRFPNRILVSDRLDIMINFMDAQNDLGNDSLRRLLVDAKNQLDFLAHKVSNLEYALGTKHINEFLSQRNHDLT